MFLFTPFIGFLLTSPQSFIAQLPTGSGFNIYCTSNLDGTGSCFRVDNNQPIECLVIPGGVIDCKAPGEPPIQCVLYSSVLDSQAFFYCTRRSDPGVRDNRLKSDRFVQPTPPTASPSSTDQILSDPLPALERPLNTLPDDLRNNEFN